MKYEELCAALRSECELDYDYIVELTYFYFSETLGPFGEETTYEIFSNGVDGLVWFNDWYEGQDYSLTISR